MSPTDISGQRMHDLMNRLWPICRSITGEGVRKTLGILNEYLPQMQIHEIPTGTECFDWKVPKEWVIRNAYIEDSKGNKVVSFSDNNLHVVNYSTPINAVMNLDELQQYLYSVPEQPTAIPYVTSYYNESWGFCLSHQLRESLLPGNYHVYIDSEHIEGSLTYGEIIIRGRTDREVFISTYVCHPSMANNELSGPCVTSMLAEWISKQENKFTYRIIFIPETIGSICYLSKHLQELKEKVFAGYVVTCVGDERAWSFMPSRQGNTYSDVIARHVLDHMAPEYKEYSFLERGSDERQYCSPGVDLPICSIMRSKYATYPEYHTSLDDMDLVTAKGLGDCLEVYKRVVDVIEKDCIPIAQVLCEPMMSGRNLRSTTGKVGSANSGKVMMNLLAYADGLESLLNISKILNKPIWELASVADKLLELGLIKISPRN